MPHTHTVRNSLAAAAVAVGLFAATPARAGWDVDLGFRANIVVPPLAISVGNLPPVAPYYGYRPYAAGCYVNRWTTRGYAPGYVPGYSPGYVPGYAPYPAPYAAPYPVAAPVVVAPRAFVRVWVPGPWPHWETRRAGRFGHRRW